MSRFAARARRGKQTNQPPTTMITPGDFQTNLKVWHKADAITGLSNGSGVSSWENSVSGRPAATQATVADQPIYTTNASPTGLPMLDLNGAGMLLESSYNVNATSYTVLAVVTPDALSDSIDTIIGASGSLQFRLDDGRPILLNTSVTLIAQAATAVSGGGPFVVGFTYDSSTGEAHLLSDSTWVASATQTADLSGGTTMFIGNRPYGGSEAFSGLIGEVAVWDAVLPEAAIFAIADGLKEKWGTPASSDSTAPSAPSNLTASSSVTTADLTWAASTDNLAVAGYEYSLDGTNYTSTNSTATSFMITGLTAATSYTISLRAYDAAGNRSAVTTVAVTTLAASGGGQKIAIIGDSLTDQLGYGTMNVPAAFSAVGWDETWFVGVSGKQIAEPELGSGLTTMDQIATCRSTFSEPELWVIALGTNDSASTTETLNTAIQSVFTALGSSAKVLWVNLGTEGVGSGDTNQQRVNAAIVDNITNWPNSYLADWRAYVDGSLNQTNWWTDGVHMTAEGYAIRNQFIAQQTLLTMTSSYSSVILASSPQLYYPMQERRGATILADASGANRPAAVYGAVSVDDAWNPHEFAPNALGRHISIYNEADNSQFIQLPSNSIDVTGGFSLEMWTWPIGWNYNTRLFDFGDISLGYVYQQPLFEVYINGASFTVPMASAKQWHHIVVTAPAGGGTAKIYIDGVLAGSGTVGVLTQTARTAMYLGRAISSGNYYRGFMTQVAVYGSELSMATVQAHYQAGLVDADPVWHGPEEWYDKTYFNQFTNAGALASNNYVPTADWMPPVMYDAAEIGSMHPYVDIGVAVPSNTDYAWYRDNGMYIMPGTGEPLVGTRGVETIGYFVEDEADMYGQVGLDRMTTNMAAVPAGFMTYANFGIYITMGMGGPIPTKENFFNMPGLHLKSVDQYFYAQDMANDNLALTYWGVPNDLLRRAYMYGYVLERARSIQDVARPLWNFVELAHPYNGYTTGGPNPDQVEGAVWASVIGGARGILYFHHSFGTIINDVFIEPDAWSATVDYGVSACVSHQGVLYYAALKPAVGEEPSLSSYTWVRWISNSVPGIQDASARHPDLPARLIKIKADLQTLAPAINSPTTPHLCHKDIYSTYRPNAHDGNKYIIALPGSGAPNGGTFDMYVPKGEAPASIEVVGESRTITPFTADGRLKFTDTFAAEYSHHIYRW